MIRTALLLLLTLALATSCAVTTRKERESLAMNAAARDALREDLRDASNRVEALLEEGAIRARGTQSTRAQREAAVVGKTRLATAFREEFNRDDEIAALLSAWTLTIRNRQYLEKGAGRELYGVNQGAALAVAREIEAVLDAVAARHLDPARIDSTRHDLDLAALGQPILGVYELQSAPNGSAIARLPGEVLGGLTRIPLLPLRAVGGISDTATSVRDFNRTAKRFADIVEDLPRETRWQAELLLLRLENSDVVTSAVASLDETARNTTRFAQVAEELPASVGKAVREAVRASAEEIARQPELRESLSEVTATAEALRSAVAEARATLGETRPLLDQLNEIGRTWEGTATEARGILQIVDEMERRAGPPNPDARPFNIVEYREASDSVRATLAEAAAILREAQTIVDRDTPPAALSQATGEMRALVDHAFRRAVQLLALAGAIVAVLVVVGRRRKEGGKS